MDTSIFWTIVIIVGIIAFVYFSFKRLAQLKAEYEEALKGLDKRKALEVGRKYYSHKRSKGLLTIYDEQAIANDIAAMDDAKKQIM